MSDYDYDTISQRLHNGYSYWRDMDAFAFIVCRNRTIRLQIESRRLGQRQADRQVGVETFNKHLVEEAPICGLSCTQTGLVWSTLLPLRHNQFNYGLSTLEFATLSHRSSDREHNIRSAFLPVYKTPGEIRADILHGRTLGGAINQKLGIAIDKAGDPVLFFQNMPIGDVDLKEKSIHIRASGWSYFKMFKGDLEPEFTLTQAEG